MSAPICEEVNTSLTGDDTHSSGSREVEDVGKAANSLSIPVTLEVARQIKAATDPLTKQLEKLCDLKGELQRDAPRRSKETSSLIQGSLRPRGERFIMVIGASLLSRSDLPNGPMNPMMRQPDHKTSTLQQPNRQQQPLLLVHSEEDLEQFNTSPIDHIVTAINNLSHVLQRDVAHTRILNTQVPNFRASKDTVHEFEHLPLNHLRRH